MLYCAVLGVRIDVHNMMALSMQAMTEKHHSILVTVVFGHKGICRPIGNFFMSLFCISID